MPQGALPPFAAANDADTAPQKNAQFMTVMLEYHLLLNEAIPPSLARQADLVEHYQVNGVATFNNGDVPVVKRRVYQCGIHRFACGIGAMHNLALAVAPFTRQVVAMRAVGAGVLVRQHSFFNHPLHAVTRMAGDKRYGIRFAQSVTGDKRIFNMGSATVGFSEHGSNATPWCTGFLLRTVTRCLSASRSASPAAALPMINTSQK
ncbi:hypothetical protein BEI72_11830 [Erwinia amylovora]|nr:hypothetical protein BEI72_11830 [Erwinia amylovora]